MNEENITLVVIGKMDQLNIEGLRIITVGRIEDESELARYYSLADAFIIPSREDNLPNVMLESMACGTPVISFNIGGMKETIRNQFNGLKAERTEAPQLAAAIKSFINTRKHFNRDEIRNFALQNYSEETIAAKYKAVYEDILT
jgi:glycosyltransferase involved in cell wall biosynthesis